MRLINIKIIPLFSKKKRGGVWEIGRSDI